MEARARILEAREEPAAERLIAANYGIGRRIYNRLAAQHVPGVYIEVRQADLPTGPPPCSQSRNNSAGASSRTRSS